MKTMTTFMVLLLGASISLAADPKLINEKRIFPKGDEKWATPRKSGLWSMRLSPDGKHLLYPRPTGKPPLTPEGVPDLHKVRYEMVLRNLQSGDETVLPIRPLESGYRTVFTRFNMFDPDGKRLALADISVEREKVDEHTTAVRRTMKVVLYDVATKKITSTKLEDRTVIAKFDRSGKMLIAMRGHRPIELFTASPPDYAAKPLTVHGMLQSVCPTADVICVMTLTRPQPPVQPGLRRKRPRMRLLLYDIHADKQVTDLPVHPDNRKLDDWETQWTTDGRFLYYYDAISFTADTPEGPRERRTPIVRIWDRVNDREVEVLNDLVAVGPGPTPTTMVLGRLGGNREGIVLHDAATGKLWPLGHPAARLQHAYGKKIVYTTPSGDDKETAYVAEIIMPPQRNKPAPKRAKAGK